MPLSAALEPKRRFIPSKHEAKRVAQLVRAIKDGKILPYKLKDEQADHAEQDDVYYDMCANEEPQGKHVRNMTAPK